MDGPYSQVSSELGGFGQGSGAAFALREPWKDPWFAAAPTGKSEGAYLGAFGGLGQGSGAAFEPGANHGRSWLLSMVGGPRWQVSTGPFGSFWRLWAARAQLM